MDLWTPEEEARRLRERFDALDAAGGPSRAKFAATHKVPGGASMLSQHLTHRRPISLEAAMAYARGFKVPLSEISPRLASLARAAVETEAPDQGRAEADARPRPAASEELVLHPVERAFILAARQFGGLREADRHVPISVGRPGWTPGWRMTAQQKEDWAAAVKASPKEDQA